jgi:hypothetical protein
LAVSDLTSPFFFRKPFEYMMAIHLFLFPPRHKNTTNSINTMNKAKHFTEQDFPKEVDMHWGGNEAISIKFESKQEFITYAVHLEKLERQFRTWRTIAETKRDSTCDDPHLRRLARDVIDEFYSMKRMFGNDKLCPGLDETMKLLIESCTDFVIIGTKEDHEDVETEFDFTPKSIPIRDGDIVFVGTKEDLKDSEMMITVPTKKTKDNKKRDG